MSDQTGPKPLIKSHGRDNQSLVRSFVSYLGAQGYSDNTRRAYGRVAADFADFLHSTSLLQIDRLITREYLAYLRDRGCSNGMVAREVHGLKALFAFLDLADLLPTNPLRLLRNPKQVRKLPKFLTEQEMERLLDDAQALQDKAGQRLSALLETLYATGARVSALCSVRLEAVNLEGRTIRIISKGNKERFVFLNRTAVKAIRKYLNGRQSGFLFQIDGMLPQQGTVVLVTSKGRRKGYWWGRWAEYETKNGKVKSVRRSQYLGTASKIRTKAQAWRRFKALVKVPTERPRDSQPLNPRRVRQLLNEIAARVGLGKVNPHKIRHTFATALTNRGVDIRHVQELLGHKNISNTQIYTHVATANLERVLAKCHPRWGKKVKRARQEKPTRKG